MTTRLNENELVYMARQKDENALVMLIDEFRPFVYKTYYQLKPMWSFLDIDECFQAYMIALNNALYYYREDKQTKFSNFVYLCTTREIKAVIRKESAHKDSVFCYASSLDNHLCDNEEIYLVDVLAKPNSDPLEMIKAASLENEAYKLLDTKIDRDILKLRLMGYNYKEMSEILGCSSKTIDNCLQRIKRKIHGLFD